MNSTFLTIIALSLILVASGYLLVYTKKKKNNTHRESGYRIAFTIALVLLVIPIIFTAF